MKKTPFDTDRFDNWDAALVRRARPLWKEIEKQLGRKAQSNPRSAAADVLLVATRFCELLKRYHRAPTRKKLRQQLERLNGSTATVIAILETRERYLIAALNMHGWREDELAAFVEQRSPTLEGLRELKKAATLALQNLALGGAVGGQKPSSGPKRALAVNCLEIFERYRPGKASTTQDGDFRNFVSHVYEIATGESDADLEKPVKAAFKLARKSGPPAPKRNPFAEILFPNRKVERDLAALTKPR